MSWELVATCACLFLGFTSTAVVSDHQAAPAEDDADDRIALIGTPEDRDFVGRIAAEVQAVHLDRHLHVVELDGASADQEVDLAAQGQARAIMYAHSKLGRIDILLVDPATRQVEFRMSLNGTPGPTVEQLLALRAVEFVRASILGRSPEPPANQPEPPRALPVGTSELPSQRPPPPATVSVVLSSGAALAQGGLGVQGEIGIQLRVRSRGSLGLNVLVLAPLTSAPIQGVAATDAGTSVWLAGADVFAGRTAGRRMVLEAGLGGMAIAMRVTGQASTGWLGSTRTAFSAGSYLRLGGSTALGRTFALRMDLLIGADLRRPVASVGGPTDYPWGHAFGLASAGIEARLF